MSKAQTTSLSIVPSQKEKTRKRTHYIEQRPLDRWFSREADQWGHKAWFLHVEITGLLGRKFGPFASRRTALLFLDLLLNKISDALLHADNCLDDFQIPQREFASHTGLYPMVERTISAKRGQR
ncbi:MAG: hypothetical protein AB7L09_15505 [Nitrospira sp.]